MKQHSKPKKVQLFSEMLNIGKNCVSCIVAMVTKIKYLRCLRYHVL